MNSILVILLCILISGCSLPPEKAVTKDQLITTGIYTHFSIKESPESVIAALNREGEAVLEGKLKGKKEYYIKLLATDTGLKVHYIEK